jgi:hypothetical protein
MSEITHCDENAFSGNGKIFKQLFCKGFGVSAASAFRHGWREG